MNDFEKQLFDIRRSVRYHMKRCRFYDSFHDVITALNVMLGVSAIYSLLSNLLTTNTIAMIVSFISAMGVIDLVIGTSRKARVHNDLANKFIDLEQYMLGKGEESLKRVISKRLEIEKTEPPVLSVLDVICHNEQVLADGYDKKYLQNIGWGQRLLSNFIDFRIHTLGDNKS